jgi:hypothetical protein
MTGMSEPGFVRRSAETLAVMFVAVRAGASPIKLSHQREIPLRRAWLKRQCSGLTLWSDHEEEITND